MVHIDKRQLNLKRFFAKDMQWKWVCMKLSGSCDVTSNRQSIDERKFFLRFYFRKTESHQSWGDIYALKDCIRDWSSCPGFRGAFWLGRNWIIARELRAREGQTRESQGPGEGMCGGRKRYHSGWGRRLSSLEPPRSPPAPPQLALPGLLALCSARVR